MDLMILIVVLLGAFLLYYLIETIRSLHQEIKDNKDIEFKTSTVDPMVGMNKSLINNMNYLKNYFDINK